MGRSHPLLVVTALHPGTVQTPLTRAYLGRHPSVTPQQAATNLWGVIDRLGPGDTGGFKDWAGKDIPW